MKLVNVKNSVLARLRPFADEYGFRVVKKDFALKRTDENGLYQLGFSYNYWQDEIHLFPYCDIKINPVHNICKNCGFDLNYTAFINLFILQKVRENQFDKDTRWKMQYARKDRLILFSKTEAEAAADKTLSLMYKYGLDYLNRYKKISEIDELYNKNPEDNYNPNCCGMHIHCIVGLIAAKLSANKEYSRLEDIYSQIMQDMDCTPETKEAFCRIKDYLTTL